MSKINLGIAESGAHPRRKSGIYTGHIFGRLIVISDDRWDENGRRIVKVKCECGKVFDSLFDSLRSGNTKSCGCLHKDKVRERLLKHGLARSPEYRAWSDMWQRCTNPKCKNYNNYGGRGIVVCSRWQEFQVFMSDMGNRPSDAHSLERVNVNGNYEPTNCTWATASQQNFNRRPTRKYRGVRPSRHDGTRFESRIVKDGITYHLGTFDTEIESAWAYDKRAVELYGPRAYQNLSHEDLRQAGLILVDRDGVRANKETLFL